MKAAVFPGVGKPLSVEDLPDPTPGSEEVVLRVERCGICATDLHLTAHAMDIFPPGVVIGHESTGEIVAVGTQVEGLKVGDFVIPHPARGCGLCAECLTGFPFWCKDFRPNMGGFAEYMVSSSASCVIMPSKMPFEDAALVEPVSVGLRAIELAEMTVGQRVLVLGAGPIGLACIFWARRLGAGHIAVAATSRRREAMAFALGASSFHVMDDGFSESVENTLAGAPDLIVECVGAPGMIQIAIDLVRTRGTVMLLGVCLVSDSLMTFKALGKEVRLQFSNGASLHQFATAADVLSSGAVEPRAMLTETVSLEALPSTFESLRQPSHQCKVMVDPWASSRPQAPS